MIRPDAVRAIVPGSGTGTVDDGKPLPTPGLTMML